MSSCPLHAWTISWTGVTCVLGRKRINKGQGAGTKDREEPRKAMTEQRLQLHKHSSIHTSHCVSPNLPLATRECLAPSQPKSFLTQQWAQGQHGWLSTNTVTVGIMCVLLRVTPCCINQGGGCLLVGVFASALPMLHHLSSTTHPALNDKCLIPWNKNEITLAYYKTMGVSWEYRILWAS